MATETTKERAAELFDLIRWGLLVTEESIREIIATQAWRALGYETFADAWDDRMKGVKLTGIMQVSLIYAMFESGADTTDVCLAVDGAGPATVKSARRAWESGLSTKDGLAFIHRTQHRRNIEARLSEDGEHVTVSAHYRRPAKKRNAITMDGFPDDLIAEWKKAAAKADMKFPEWCAEIFTAAANEKVGI